MLILEGASVRYFRISHLEMDTTRSLELLHSWAEFLETVTMNDQSELKGCHLTVFCLEVYPMTEPFYIQLFVGRYLAAVQEYIIVTEGPWFQEPTFGLCGHFHRNCLASTNVLRMWLFRDVLRYGTLATLAIKTLKDGTFCSGASVEDNK